MLVFRGPPQAPGYMIKSTLKIARYCPLVIQGFSNFLVLFQVIMANPVFGSVQHVYFTGCRFSVMFQLRNSGPDCLSVFLHV